MEGEEERKDTEGSFSKASIPKRMAIVAAGGFVNIIFGLIIYFMLVSFSSDHISNVVEQTVDGLSTQTAGIQVGDQILKINDQKIRLKSDLEELVQENGNKEMTVLLKRGDNVQEIKLQPSEVKSKTTGIYLSGISEGEKATQIVQIDENSNAAKQGLKVQDIIKKVNGIDVIGNQEKIVEIINGAEGDQLLFTVERDGEELEIAVEPNEISNYYLGTIMKVADNNVFSDMYYGFWQTLEFGGSILDNLKMLFTGKVGLDQMMGPVGISSVVSQTQGIQDFVYMLALISLSLGVTNLLPIPALDGGKLLLLIIEAIRRKPMKEELEIGIQMLGFSILIVLSIFIAYKDIVRIF